MARELVKIINIQRSTPGRTFGAHVYLDKYNADKASGKLGSEWILEEEIKSIEEEIVNDGLGNRETIVEEVEETPAIEELNDSDTDEVDLETLSLEELKALAKERGVKVHPAAKEKGIIKKLQAAE